MTWNIYVGPLMLNYTILYVEGLACVAVITSHKFNFLP